MRVLDTLRKLRSSVSGGLGRNSIASLCQALIGAVTLFVVYRQAVMIGGTELIGLWSLTVGLVSFMRLADLSGGGALARLAAVARSDTERAAVIDAVALFQLGFYAVLCVVLFWPFLWALRSLTEGVDPEILSPLVMGTLAALVVNVLASGQSNALDGVFRADLRALANIVGFIIFAVAALLLLPQYGIVGLAVAQFVQMAITLVMARVMLCRLVPTLSLLPIRGTWKAFRGAISYGMRLQVMGVAGLIFDPLSRFAINSVAGLETLAVYEIAYRLVAQTRALITAATMPMVPVFAKLHDMDRPQAEAKLYGANRIIGFASVLSLGMLCLVAPLIGGLILPDIGPLFLTFVVGLASAYCVNAFAIPVFLYAQGSGQVLWNILGQLSIALASVGSIQALALVVPADYAALGTALGLFIGSWVTIVGNAVRFGFAVMAPIVHSLIGFICVSVFGLMAFQIWRWP